MNEENRFQAEFRYTPENYKEFTKINLEAHFRNTALYLLASVCLVFLIFMLQFGTSATTLLILSLFWLGLFAFRWFRNRDGGVDYKRLIHNNGDQIPCQRVFVGEFGVRTLNESTGKDVTDTFDSIRYAMESKNLLILVDHLKLCHIIDKNTLQGGSSQELIAYLRENCGKMKKNVRSGKFGRIVKYLLIGLNAAALLASIAVMLHIPEKLSGKLTNDMSYREMAAALESCDIHITDQAIRELEEFDAQYALEYGDYYKDNPGSSKVYDLLYWEGGGTFNEDYTVWTPSRSGVYWFDMEVLSVDRIYTDFLSGISAMAPELNITDVTEYYNKVNWDDGTGIITFQFSMNGQVHEITATMQQDWLDLNAMYALGEILRADQDPQDLWYIAHGQGILLYYGTQAQMKELSRLTGLTFYNADKSAG